MKRFRDSPDCARLCAATAARNQKTKVEGRRVVVVRVFIKKTPKSELDIARRRAKEVS